MRNKAATTNHAYAHCLALWLNFLLSRDRQWWNATDEDAEEFEFWRLTDPANESTVGTSAFAKDVAACKLFYKWASGRFGGVIDVFADVDFPVAKREASVKWLDPAAIARWRDVGVRGRLPDGRRDRSWRGRNEQRDAAFVDGLYSTGLRLSEWASVVLPELPVLRAGRGFYTAELANRCAKGGYGHRYWIGGKALSGVRAYVEGARARAVRSAQAEGRYEALARGRVVEAERGRESVVLADGQGGTVIRSWGLLAPAMRRRLFRRTPAGLEPLAVWLNEDGLPRDPHGWHHTFDAANERIARGGWRTSRRLRTCIAIRSH
ncbi:hypothetical protein [Nocardia asiatica]